MAEPVRKIYLGGSPEKERGFPVALLRFSTYKKEPEPLACLIFFEI